MAINISRGLHYIEQCAQNHLQVTYLMPREHAGPFDLIVAEGFGGRGVQKIVIELSQKMPAGSCGSRISSSNGRMTVPRV